MTARPLIIFGWLFVATAVAVGGPDLEEFRVKREAVFEFAAKPTLTRDGDRVTIAFETRGFCDVTVAVEDAEGQIVRHLASGVLGQNAPAPFAKNSKRQQVIWDGKDDQDRYVKNLAACTVRVSLGLKPRLQKTLFHSPYKRFGRNQPVIAPAPEGVYVYEGDIVDAVRLFDHEGNYVRTVYPFPAGKVKQVQGLRWHTAPQDLPGGRRLPRKEGYHQATFLSGGYNSGYDKKSGYGRHVFLTAKHYDGSPSYNAASAMAVRGVRVALVRLFLNRLATDGGSGGLDLRGPKTYFTAIDRGYYSSGKTQWVVPSSAAFSPDGKWLYLAGYDRDEAHGTGGTIKRWLHGVVRMRFDGDAEPELFAGAMSQDASATGARPGEFNVPTAVACDRAGRVYVADYTNDRIQVFSAAGEFLKSIRAVKPARLAIHHKTGELYVCSFVMKSWEMRKNPVPVKPVLRRYGAFEDPRELDRCPLPLLGHQENRNTWDSIGGSQYVVALDSWTDPPTLWLVGGAAGRRISWRQAGIKLLTVGDGRLTVKRDFGAETLKATRRDAPAGRSRQRLAVNPKTGRLFLIEALASHQIVEIDPDTGKDRLVDLPFSAEDLCFDANGLAYLRTGSLVARYDPRTWREIPWDYGEERQGVHHAGGRAGDVASGLMLPGKRASPWYHGGGFGVSVKGHLVVQCFNGSQYSPKRDRAAERVETAASVGGELYTPRLFPGRRRWGEIHVWDRHGKLIHADAVPGIGITDGVAIDKDDNIYVLANPARTPGGERELNPKTETLIKFRPQKSQVITTLRNNTVPLKIEKAQEPDGPTQFAGHYMGAAWVREAEWLYGGVGYAGGRCVCWNARFALDYFARSFVPEPGHFSVAVLDAGGNLILRVGQYGNVDDGAPLVPHPARRRARSIGGDEVALMHACYVAAETDRRLFIADAGNRRILAVALGYHTTKTIALKDVPDRKE